MTRSVLIAAALALSIVPLGGCPTAANEAAGVNDDDPGDYGTAQCAADTDCVPAGSSCCECPTYALPVTSGYDTACEDLGCDAPAGCADRVAVCQSGSCVLQCRVIHVSDCPSTCPSGYQADSAGCLTCACKSADPAAAECAADADCTRVPADCCGCARGGADTAVPAEDGASFEAGLDCGSSSQCPEVNVCDPDEVPRCVGGACTLAPAENAGLAPDAGAMNPASSPQYCGTDDYPECPSGQICVLNSDASAEANMAGVGVCEPE